MRFVIQKGPAAKIMVEAFSHAYDQGTYQTVTFEGTGWDSTKVSVKVTMLEYESGASGMYIFGGYLRTPKEWIKIKGFYNANQQTGHFSRVE